MKYYFLTGIFALNICIAATCPPPHWVERRLENSTSKITYNGLTYEVYKSLFTGELYQLSKTSFVEGVLRGKEKFKKDTVICAYSSFSQYDRQWGDVLLKAHYSFLVPQLKDWTLYEGELVCVNSEVQKCSFFINSSLYTNKTTY